ncbi:hypothetical protein SAMN04487949_3403 [Halogranum gelatinilyticum]|uniref:Uncharacterized protein n=1 Tax=Halogranum gelatinilyticum TaxID=660521 RepID=A0A1G9YRM4_9EURY|nr:hypothetical protein [Halogranum gelatinilyticum]SDN11046.1 hypothetical protein SAMN04487949_3403 [Halogranum gelatinilyticum]
MRQNFLSVLFALDAVLLVLLAVGFLFVEPGSTAYAISQVSLAIILLTLVAIGVAIRRGVQFYEP